MVSGWRKAYCSAMVVLSLGAFLQQAHAADQAVPRAPQSVSGTQLALLEDKRLEFPDGTATPSEKCGRCHKEIYQEYTQGTGSDLHWPDMKLVHAKDKTLSMPDVFSRKGTAHYLAGIDPWPVAARDYEEQGRQCNVCHYPEPLTFPKIDSPKIDKPIPRKANQEFGITCASCHLTADGKIRGPYAIEDAPHDVVQDTTMSTSAACAYCHSVGERVVGKQTQTFLEWRDDYFNRGLGKQQCQDCHMPKTVRKLVEKGDNPERVVARHLWTGGHSFQRIQSALDLAVVQPQQGIPNFVLAVTNIGAGHSVPTGSNRRAVYLIADAVDRNGRIVAHQEWMFAPWMLGRPDDKKFVEEDLKGEDPVATSQADAQGPHETTIRAGEKRLLEWAPILAPGNFTVQAKLVYDLNRYNDRSFKDDQREIGHVSVPVTVAKKAASN